MKLNKIVEISLHRVRQNKNRNLIISVPIILIMILLLSVNVIQYSIKAYIESIEDNIQLRTIDGISYRESEVEEIIAKLQEIEHIEMTVDIYERQIYADEYCEQLKTPNTNGYTYIQPITVETCPEVIKGEKITNDDKYSVIIPSKVCANGTTNDEYYNEVLEKQNIENMYIDGEQLLDKKITIRFEKNGETLIEREFQVVGIYDSERYYNMETLYIPKSTIKEINTHIGYKPSDYFMKIIVDKTENINQVEEKLNAEGIKTKGKIQSEAQENNLNTMEEKNISLVTNLTLETQNVIKKLSLYFLVASVLIFLALIIATNINKMYSSSMELGILKVEGYTDKEIQKIMIIENIIVCIISIIISFIIFEVLRLMPNLLIDYIINNNTIGITMNKIREQIYYIKKVPQKLNVFLAIVTPIILIAIESINTFFINKRILSKSIKEILKNQE